MKTLLKMSLFCLGLFLFSSTAITAQRTITLISDGVAVSTGIDDATKDQVLVEAQKLLNSYYEIADFWDSNREQFDEDKYTSFISLFSGSARVYDDIADEPSNVEYSVYANNVFQYMQEEGVQFDLENAYLNSIEIDESGFYIADIDIEKVVFIGLNKDNFPTRFGDEGRRYALNLKMNFADYDVTASRIQSIVGEEAAKRVATAAYLSADFHYGLGSFIEGTPTNAGNVFGALTNKSASVLGAQLFFRKALNSKEAMWFHIGAGAQQHSLKFSFDNFDNSTLEISKQLEEDFSGAFINGAIPQGYPVKGNLEVTRINQSQEALNIVTVDVPIGVSFRVIRNFSNRLFIDVSAVPSFSLSSQGESAGTIEGQLIPKSPHFPGKDAILASDRGAERLEEYNISRLQNADAFNLADNDIIVDNRFNLGVQISPTYQYDISFNYGIEIGVNLWYNVLSLTNGNAVDIGYLASKIGGANSSILQDYYSGVNPFYASVKLGFFYKLK